MNITFKWLGGGSWLLSIDNYKVVCDPVLCLENTIHDYGYFSSKRINEPKHSIEDMSNVNLWLFTHGHKDHLDFGGNHLIASNGKIVCDASAGKRLKKLGLLQYTLLRWGSTAEVDISNFVKMSITAIPAIHGVNKGVGRLVGNGNGYWIDITKDNKTFSIYTSGDTLPNKQTLSAIQNRNCDLFIANVGNATVGNGLLAKVIGRITMNMKDVGIMRTCFNVQKVIPIHWDAFEHYQERNVFTKTDHDSFTVLNPGESLKVLSWQ